MYKLYFKQAWNLIRQERLFSLIYIGGTGLSVTMVMVLSIVFYLKVASIYPETNRSRMLVAKSGVIKKQKGDGSSSGQLSMQMLESAFGGLKGIEAIGAVYENFNTEYFIRPENRKEEIPVAVRFVNRDFWTVFSFRFLEGKPFTEADLQSGIKAAVISRSMARQLFGAEKAEGKYISLNFRQYRVCGVVEDVSQITPVSYGQLWVPYTTSPSYSTTGWESTGMLGRFQGFMLVDKEADINRVKREAEESVTRLDHSLPDVTFSLMGQPDKYWQSVFRRWSSQPVDFTKVVLQYALIFFMFLIVPAVSLSGMADSRMERRLAEMGVRRAFGAPVQSLMKQVLAENFIFTLLGGLFGLLLSYLIVMLSRSWIMLVLASGFDNGGRFEDVTLSPSMLMNGYVFVVTLVVCFLLNLFSALIPAWRAAHRQIVLSLNAK
ncbi:ABC transporter permease [Parabacteroides sp.]